MNDTQTESTYLKAACQHCKGHIGYPSVLAGQSVECPHCNQRTTLPPPLTPRLLPVINRESKELRRPLASRCHSHYPARDFNGFLHALRSKVRRIYDAAGNLIETHEQAGEFKEP